MSEDQPRPLQVLGCADKIISEFIIGVYVPHSSNHGKVVYKKEKRPVGHDVLIYYWHDDEDPEESGWWFGPNVGGNQVWAFHPQQEGKIPPLSGWVVPHDADVDPTFKLSPAVSTAQTSAKSQATLAHDKKVAASSAAKGVEKRISAEKRKRIEEEDRKKWEEDVKRRKEEKRKEREERRRKEEQIRQEEEERRRQEELRQRKEEERLKQEELRRKQAEEERRAALKAKKIEDEARAKLLRQHSEEERKKRQEEAKVERQQRAANTVLRSLHRLSNAKDRQEFLQLWIELGQVMATDLPRSGAQKDFLAKECNRVLEYAQEKVDQQRQREVEEIRKKERTPEQVLKDLESVVVAAEKSLEPLQNAVAPLEGSAPVDETKVLELSLVVEKAANAAVFACATARAALLEESDPGRADESAKASLEERLQVALQRVVAITQAVATVDIKAMVGERAASA